MLVLTRKKGEKIEFPGLGITIEVLETKSGRTKLGVTAPDDVDVVRQELLPEVPQAEPGNTSPEAQKPKKTKRRR